MGGVAQSTIRECLKARELPTPTNSIVKRQCAKQPTNGDERERMGKVPVVLKKNERVRCRSYQRVEIGRHAGDKTQPSGKSDVLGGTFLGGAGCVLLGAFASLSFGNGLGISTHDLMLTLFMGAFTIGIGIALVTWGTGYVPAAEVSLLVLTESVLGPIWPWIILGQAMTLTEIGGGVIVLGAVAALAIASREPGKPAAVKG